MKLKHVKIFQPKAFQMEFISRSCSSFHFFAGLDPVFSRCSWWLFSCHCRSCYAMHWIHRDHLSLTTPMHHTNMEDKMRFWAPCSIAQLSVWQEPNSDNFLDKHYKYERPRSGWLSGVAMQPMEATNTQELQYVWIADGSRGRASSVTPSRRSRVFKAVHFAYE